MVAICPEGQQSMFWKDGKSSWGRPNIHFLFSRPLCFQSSAREKCSRGKKNGRHLTVSPRPALEMLKQARAREQTERFKEEYKRRAGVGLPRVVLDPLIARDDLQPTRPRI